MLARPLTARTLPAEQGLRLSRRLSGERHDLRAEERAIAGKQRNVVDDARGGDQLIRRVATNIKLRTGARDFAR